MRAFLLAASLMALAAVTLGCASSGSGTPSPGVGAPGGSTPIAPGYTPASDGTAQVVGYLQRSDLEGGFWAVYGSPETSSGTGTPTVLAVLLPGSVDEAGIAALEGTYVRASGRISTGASSRMAGPEVLVDGIAVVQEP